MSSRTGRGILFLLAIGTLLSWLLIGSNLHALVSGPIEPARPWTVKRALTCDLSHDLTFQSSWPGDTPQDAMEQYVEALNQSCSGQYGVSYTAEFTLNNCDPTISVTNQNGNAWGTASGCTIQVHVAPKPSCGPSCTPWDTQISAPTASKTCSAPPAYANSQQFVLTSAPSYGECMCPSGTLYDTGTKKCLPVVDQTQKFCDQANNCSAGNPIMPGTGNKRQVEVDYAGHGALPLDFRRIYNSIQQSGSTWTTNYARSVTYSKGDGTYAVAVLNRPEGRFSFIQTAGQWVPDADVSLYRLAGTNNSFTVTRTDTLEKEYYDARNNLYRISSRWGDIKYHLTYSDSGTSPSIAPVSGLLIQVSTPFGHVMQFTYDALSQLSTMTDPNGRLYQYVYDGSGNLSSVTYPDSRVRQYVYNESSLTSGANLPRALTGIIDEDSNRLANFGYNTGGLAILSEYAGGVNRYEVSYGTAPGISSSIVLDGDGQPKYVARAYSAPSGVVMTDAMGTARNISFGIAVGTVKATGSDKACVGRCTPIPQSQAFDANGNLISRTDFNGNLTTYVFDTNRNVETSRTEASTSGVARTILTSWDSTLRLPAQVTEPNRTTGYWYSSDGDVTVKRITDTSITPNVQRTWSYGYTSYGRITLEDGPRTDVSDVTTYSYYNCTSGNQCGQLYTITNALGQTTTFNSYNAHAQPLTITDPNGLVTTLTYDFRQRLTSQQVGTETTTFEYWPTGLLKKTTAPDGSYLQYTYDNAHRLIKVEDQEGNRIEYTLDALGNRTAESVYDPSSALKRTSTQVFNSLNQLWKQVGAAGTAAVTTVFGYDTNGNQTSINAPLGRNTAQLYDELNRLIESTDAESGITEYGYDANDNLTSVTDPRTLVTTYEYNGFGDLKKQTSPDTGITTQTYESGGNLKTRTDARGITGTRNYDALNRLTSVVYPDQTITYTYDTGVNNKGRLMQVSDGSGSTAWTYTSQGRVASRTQAMGAVSKTVSYGYNASGQLTSITTPSGQALTYNYANGKVTGITVNNTTLLSNLVYEPFGPIARWEWGNTTLSTRAFDTDGNVTQIDAGLKTYTYDDAFRITGITDSINPALSWTYEYDGLDRLTEAASIPLTETWTYDPNGSRLTQGGTASSTYTVSGSSNRLTAVTGALTRSYSYDAMGNILTDGTYTFTYNNAGRMVSKTGGTSATYVHNALGQRVKKTVSSASTYFVYDEAGHLLGEYDGSGNLIQETVWLGDIPVATLRPSGGGGVNFLYTHTDHLNTPRRLTRPSDNAILWRWDSNAFGTTAANEDPDGDTTALVYNLRFPGQYYDGETGLNYNHYRDYDPATGRYVQSDPIGLDGGINTYAYAFNNPFSNIDPDGRFAFAIPLIPPALAAAGKAAAFVGSAALAAWAVSEACKEDGACPPCKTISGKVVPLGTVGYRPLDTPPAGKVQHGISGPHYNIYRANQAPKNSPQPCKCFWQPLGAVTPTALPPGSIPIEPFSN